MPKVATPAVKTRQRATQSTAPKATLNAAAKTPAPRAKTKASAAPAAVKRASTAAKPVAAKQAKQTAVAKAKRIAKKVPARIGSTPTTQFRGNPDIFGRLVEDHDHHRALLAMIAATKGETPERKRLFKELVKELKGHAAAEEQALWSSVMRNPKTTDAARHAVGEHKELDSLMADVAARDMASSGWLRHFAKLHEKYLHHIREEEQEQFVAAQKHLTPADLRYMKQVFNRRKREEKASATIVKKIKH